MRKSNLTVWLLTLFVASMGGVEPSNADVCFIVGGCEKPKIETRDCNKLGYTDKSCDGVREIVYDTCVSKGEKFVKCTCNPNYYMLTASPSNATAYDIEECTKVDGKKLYRATCKSDYKYALSTITREDGETETEECDKGKTPVAAGGICTMLYGTNANKVLYKDCDCNSSYIYKKETPGFSYSGACTYKYGKKASETWYTTVTCDTSNSYQSTDCSSPKVVDDTTTVKNSQKTDLLCWKCKCPATYQYPAQMQNGITGSNEECGTLWDKYTCPAKLLANCPSGAVCDTVRGAEAATSSAYNAKCYKCNLNVHKYLSSTDTTNYADFITFGGECKQDNISHYRDASCKSPYQSTDCASGYEKDGGDKILYTYNRVKTLSCWKCKASCPAGYTSGSCPYGEICWTKDNCYKKPACEDINSAVTHMTFKKDVKVQHCKTRTDPGHVGEVVCNDSTEEHRFEFKCTIKNLTSDGSGRTNEVKVTDAANVSSVTEVKMYGTTYTHLSIKNGLEKDVLYNSANKALTDLSTKTKCYYKYPTKVCTLKDLDSTDPTPDDGKVHITISKSGSCMIATQTCSGCGGNGRGYIYNSAVVGVYDTEGNKLCEVSVNSESSCSNLEPGTYEVTTTSGASSEIKTYCGSYNDIKGVTVNGTKYESVGTYTINFSAGSYTITPICYTGKGNNC